MVGMMALICLILIFAHHILSAWIVGSKRVEITKEGKDVVRWVKIVLAVIGILASIVIAVIDPTEGKVTKWFWMSFVIIALGFQSFMDWKQLKGSKQYIVSLIVLILGVILVYFLI